MEDGDVIDALLQQACAHLILKCLRLSSRLFRSEVAHAFAHDLSIFDLENHVDCHRQCFFSCVVPINRSIYYPRLVLNFVESATSGKTILRLRQRL